MGQIPVGSVPGLENRHFDGFNQAGGIGTSFPGNVIGGAVVHGCPDNGQSQGDIHPVLEMNQLKGNQSLVMVHAHHGITTGLYGVIEHRIRGHGPLNIQALVLCGFDSRGNDSLFFMTEKTGFSGMGIQSGHGQAGGFNIEPGFKICTCQMDNV
jgi:hypothetical protein